MAGAKGRTRQERGLVDMSASSAPSDPPWGEDTGPTQETTETWPTIGALEGFEAQVVIRTVRYVKGGELRGFAAMLQVREADTDEEAWADVCRVDTAHGYVHIDRYNRSGTPTKDSDRVPPGCRESLDAALAWAIEYVWEIEERVAAWR